MALLLVVASSPAHARDRQAARRTFDEAARDEESLRAASPKQQTFARYRDIIQAYRKVLDLDPTYGACDDALYRAAGLCREAGQRFRADEYLTRAVHYLTWLRREYPYSPLRDDALLLLGDIQAVDLGDRAAARESYEEFLRRYSKSDRIDEAVRKLNDLEPSTPPATPPVTPATAAQELAVGLSARLTDIRFWSTSDYTRVVMDLDREVDFVQKEIDNPYRIYFDFQHTILSHEVKNRDFSIGDAFLHRIRVGQNQTDIARVVLDFKTRGSFSVFPLYNPFRVVIDIKDADKGKTLRERKEKLARIFSGRAESTAPPAGSVPAPKKDPPGDSATAAPPPARSGDESAPLRPSGPTASGEHTLPRILGMKVGKIVIDPGHGGKDSGSIGYRGLMEKDLVLSIARQLKDEIERRLNVEVILTRDRDVFLPLEQRTAIANMAGADLFISIHANADNNNRVAGIETFYLGLTRDKRSQLLASIENAASQQSLAKLESSIKKITMYEKMNESKDFATKVHQEFFKTLHQLHPATKDRGVKKAPFVVLIGTDVPSILLEIGYISNRREAQIISSASNQKKLAVAICSGIEEYLVNLGTLARDSRTQGDVKDQGHGQ